MDLIQCHFKPLYLCYFFGFHATVSSVKIPMEEVETESLIFSLMDSRMKLLISGQMEP